MPTLCLESEDTHSLFSIIRFHIASPLEATSDDVFGAEEHNLSVHSDAVCIYIGIICKYVNVNMNAKRPHARPCKAN